MIIIVEFFAQFSKSSVVTDTNPDITLVLDVVVEVKYIEFRLQLSAKGSKNFNEVIS